MTSTCCDSHVMRVHIDGKTTFHCSKCSKIQGNQMSAGARMKRHERRQQPPELKIVATEQPDEPNVYTISEQKEETVVITGTEIQEPIEVPKPRVFVPRPCSMCTSLRPPNTSYSKVYTTRGSVRYCRCEFCGNTWSQSR